MGDLMARLRSRWEELNARERVLVSIAGVAVLACIVIVGIVNPLLSAASNATARVATAERRLETVERLREKYDQVNSRLSQVENRIRSGARGEIFTTLESLASQSAVKVDSMEPRTSPASDDYKETKVQVALKQVTLAQLVTYLHAIESHEQVLSIKSLRIRTRNDKPEVLDVTFTVSSFEPA